MKNLLTALLYTGLIATANPGWSETDLAALRDGDLRKLVLHESPKPLADATFEGPHGPVSLAEHYRGQVVVLNFWALWCAPCREEMPTLDALQQEFGGEDFAVVTVATGPNAPPPSTSSLTRSAWKACRSTATRAAAWPAPTAFWACQSPFFWIAMARKSPASPARPTGTATVPARSCPR